jgi:hypothetical protein
MFRQDLGSTQLVVEWIKLKQFQYRTGVAQRVPGS